MSTVAQKNIPLFMKKMIFLKRVELASYFSLFLKEKVK